MMCFCGWALAAVAAVAVAVTGRRFRVTRKCQTPGVS